MQNVMTLFGTDIYTKQCDLDLDKLMSRCHAHFLNQTTAELSNRGGGYQGQHFRDAEFESFIHSCWPKHADRPVEVDIQSWVNINGFGAWNALHNHLNVHVLLSGVFYVKAAPGCGKIMFYDPRYLSSVGTYYEYYYPEDGGYFEIEPRPNLLLFFPPSLFHMVAPNLTNQERCSIAFNICLRFPQKTSNIKT